MCVLVKVFGGNGAAGCVCVCVSFRLLWGAQNARWCLLNSKALPLSTGAPQCGPHAVWNDQLRFRQAEFSNTQSYLLLRFSHRPFQPLFQVQHVVRNSRWMKVTARAREQISSAREDNAVLLPQRCPLLSKPIEELFEWEKQGGSVFQPCCQVCERASACLLPLTF